MPRSLSLSSHPPHQISPAANVTNQPPAAGWSQNKLARHSSRYPEVGPKEVAPPPCLTATPGPDHTAPVEPELPAEITCRAGLSCCVSGKTPGIPRQARMP